MLFDRRAKVAFIIAAVTMVVGGIGFRSAVGHLNVYLRKKPVELRLHLASIPKRLGPWEAQGEDHKLPPAIVETLGTDKYVQREYRHRDDPDARLMLHIAYYTGMIDAVPHIPDRCFVASGWEPSSTPSNQPLAISFDDAADDPLHRSRQTGEPYRIIELVHPVTGMLEEIRLPSGEYQLRASDFQRGDLPNRRLYGGYFFLANNRLTASPEYIRSLAFKPSERYAYYAKVQLVKVGAADDGQQIFIDQSSDFVQRLLPHLMRCLPDWAEVESQEQSPSPNS